MEVEGGAVYAAEHWPGDSWLPTSAATTPAHGISLLVCE